MAIKVIEHGQKKFTTICSKCGCKFEYELDDITGNFVECPECGERIYHSNQDGSSVHGMYKYLDFDYNNPNNWMYTFRHTYPGSECINKLNR